MYVHHTYSRTCTVLLIHSFIHSFTHSGCFYSASTSPLLLWGALDTSRILCRNFTPKRHRQLWTKDLPKVPIRGVLRASLTHDSSSERRRLCQCATHAHHTLAYVYMHVDIPDENKAGLHGEYLPSFTLSLPSLPPFYISPIFLSAYLSLSLSHTQSLSLSLHFFPSLSLSPFDLSLTHSLSFALSFSTFLSLFSLSFRLSLWHTFSITISLHLSLSLAHSITFSLSLFLSVGSPMRCDRHVRTHPLSVVHVCCF